MPVLVAALMLGAVGSSPPDDDDRKRSVRTPAAATRPPDDHADKPKTASSPRRRDHDDDDEDEARTQPDSPILVTARRLDTARTQIDAGLGAAVYALTNETIENRPGGETGHISDILAQAPGASLVDGRLVIRGSAANQVRINNVIVPEAISDPADHLSARLAETTRLLTGTLPAQYGFAPAGVISVTTKNGLYEHGGQAELFAGTDGTVEPAFEWAGSAERTSLFASGSLEHDRSTVADAMGIAARERRTESEGLGFADHVIDRDNRVSLIVGGSHEHRRIGPTGIGSGTEDNRDGYTVGTFQHSDDGFTAQASLFAGIASDRARFRDPTRERRSAFGTQIDASDAVGASHRLQFGLLASRSSARELDRNGDKTRAARTAVALYAQDEWTLAPSLTFNPGARLEWLRGISRSTAVEPRANLVWQPGVGSTVHAGFARYASAVPVGEAPVRGWLPDERDDVFDAGVQQKFGSLTLGVDGYWRLAHNLIAEHETPGSAVRTPFAFRRARIGGLELSAVYAHDATTAWANLSLARARARTIIGSEGLFATATIAAASSRSVPLAGGRPVTASGGFTQRLGKFSLSGDMLISSGAVRTLDLLDPNGARHSAYAVVGLAAVYHARIADKPSDIRLDLTNLTNVHYLTSDATGLEGGWTRPAHGRAITIGIEQGF